MRTHAQLSAPGPWFPYVAAMLFLAAVAAWLNAAQGQPGGQGKASVSADGKLKFQIFQDKKKEYRWRLLASNGQTLATGGQGYRSKSDVMKAVERIQTEAGTGQVKFDLYEDARKEYRWRMKAGNNQIIAASSDGYKTKATVEKAVDRIKTGAKSARVEEEKP